MPTQETQLNLQASSHSAQTNQHQSTPQNSKKSGDVRIASIHNLANLSLHIQILRNQIALLIQGGKQRHLLPHFTCSTALEIYKGVHHLLHAILSHITSCPAPSSSLYSAHDDVVDGDEDQLHKEPDEPHHDEPQSRPDRHLRELCTPTTQNPHINPPATPEKQALISTPKPASLPKPTHSQKPPYTQTLTLPLQTKSATQRPNPHQLSTKTPPN
ncbi:hypothetical protein M758_11G051500 [Ceratodon purpureus]|nr:hypothetical protein M758_11G051500 [Ceratodon purpureus]